jgi:hypothetical protein
VALIHPPLVASLIPQLVSKPVKDFLTFIDMKSMKVTWNMVLASHRSSMGRTTHIRRSACRLIFRVLGTASRIFVSTLCLMLQVIKSLQFKLSSMIRTTKLSMLCSCVSRLLSLSELVIWLWLTRSGPPLRYSMRAIVHWGTKNQGYYHGVLGNTAHD